MNWSLISFINETLDSPRLAPSFTAVDEWNLSSTPNMSDETSAPQCRRQSPEVAFIRNFELSTKSAIVVLSVAANVFLFVMLFRYGNMRSRAILFMANLCAADLAVSLLSNVSFIVELLTQGFKGGMVLCKLVRYLQLFGPYAASFAIVSMGVDRYLAIVHPLSSYSRSDRLAHAGWLLAAPWLLSALVASPQLFLFTLSLRNCTLTADAENLRHSSTEPPHLLSITICGDIYESLPLWILYASITFHIVIIYFIPAIILVYSYAILSSRVWSARALISNARLNYNMSKSTTGSTTGPTSANAKTSVAGVALHSNHFGGGGNSFRGFEKILSLEPSALLPEPQPLHKSSNISDHLCNDIQVLLLPNHRDKGSGECAASGSASQSNAVGGPTEFERPVLRGASKRSSWKAEHVRAHFRTLLITFVIVMLFILSWAPYAVTHLLWLLFPHIAENTLMVQLGVSLCSILGSCLDPLIYMAFNLRNLFKQRQTDCARAASASDSRSSRRLQPSSTAANAIINQ